MTEKEKTEQKSITWEQYEAIGNELYGEKKRNWKFVCPSCKHVATAKEWIDAGAEQGEIGFSCIGRHIEKSEDFLSKDKDKKGPCNYAGGGLFRINPVQITYVQDGKVEKTSLFEFADMNFEQMLEKLGI